MPCLKLGPPIPIESHDSCGKSNGKPPRSLWESGDSMGIFDLSKLMMYAPKVSSFSLDGLYFPSLRHWLSHEQWQFWAPCEARNMGSKVQLHLTSVCPENRAMRALEAGVEPKCCGGKMCLALIQLYYIILLYPLVSVLNLAACALLAHLPAKVQHGACPTQCFLTDLGWPFSVGQMSRSSFTQFSWWARKWSRNHPPFESCLEQWRFFPWDFHHQNSFGMAEKEPLPSHSQPVQAQGVKSWKMHVHEKSVWEVFGEEARWMVGVLAPKVTSEKNGRKVMIKVMMI